MTKREIGSEYWSRLCGMYPNNTDNEVYLLSGRTALRFIIDDIGKTRKIRRVLLPSYCCESMIQPFASMDVEVQFYQVHKDCFEYSYENDADVILLIDFFGYTNPQNSEIARREQHAGKIIIYDATHKIDGNPSVQNYADYCFCSYRKWFYCNYAKALKRNGSFVEIDLKANDRYIEIRDKAAHAKENYFSGLTVGKEEYLSLFSTAEQMLDKDYVGYSGKPVAFDICEIVSKRRENAAYLIDKLKRIPEIKLWRDELRTDDVPMFVPILVDSQVRNDLRRTLINESIYCPIHWPVSSFHGECNELYDTELSLICDQRYDIEDMERMVRVIRDYFKK